MLSWILLQFSWPIAWIANTWHTLAFCCSHSFDVVRLFCRMHSESLQCLSNSIGSHNSLPSKSIHPFLTEENTKSCGELLLFKLGQVIYFYYLKTVCCLSSTSPYNSIVNLGRRSCLRHISWNTATLASMGVLCLPLHYGYISSLWILQLRSPTFMENKLELLICALPLPTKKIADHTTRPFHFLLLASIAVSNHFLKERYVQCVQLNILRKPTISST